MHSARHLDSTADDVAIALRRRGREVFPLSRRGADLGQVVSVHRRPPDERTQQQLFRNCEPIFLPDVLGDAPARYADAIEQSLRMFDRLRSGAEWLDELDARVGDDDELRYAGSTIDQHDPRCIERCFVDVERQGATIASDLWAMLAWITADEPDDSLRIRFSNGLDQLEEWMATGDFVASQVDRLARRAFPECDAILRCAALRQRLDALLDHPHRLSERIVYNNAPHGGAVFHHDAEPGQLGVVFAQLEGRTAWFALGKRRLARLLVRYGTAPTERTAMAALDRADDPILLHVLNRDADFARLLAAHGALFLLRAGDAIVLPSRGVDDVAWHSVLAIDDRPSLAHSYGIFARGADYDPDGDPWLLRRRRRRTTVQR